MARILALAAVVAALTASAASGAEMAERHSYVVLAAPGDTARAAAAIRRSGGAVVRMMPGVDAIEARLPAGAAAQLRTDAGVRSVVRDSGVQLTSTDYDAKSDVHSLFNAEQIVGARSVWENKPRGYTGVGIDVAVIDSGVAPVAGMDTPGKVVHGPDLSFESQNPGRAHVDNFGHGTHIAGIIAGHDADATAKTGVGNDKAFLGVAPDARIVSVKVADRNGAADVSQVIAAIDWVVQHRNRDGLNIRVLNLSFATPSLQPWELDPLAHAADVAWRKGIVVVAAAGNDGTGTGKLLTPAQNPRIIAVGAVDPRGTMSTDDDVIPSFSTRGDGVRNPDLVAPGASLQSLRVPGSSIDAKYGQGAGSINARFLRGSGTSQAAAVASGIVALLLEARPELSPDAVKAVLLRAARPLPNADVQAQGRGVIDIRRAISDNPKLLPTRPRATGHGSLDASRGGLRLTLNGVVLDGERDIFGMHYDAVERAAARESETAWVDGTWNGSVWTGSTWAGSTWAGSTWAGTTWVGSTWAGTTWVGTTWVGTTWAGTTWVGTTWAVAGWQ